MTNYIRKINLISFLSFFLVLPIAVPDAAFSATDTNPRVTPVVLAVKRVSPAVVNVSSEYEAKRTGNPFSAFGFDPLFDSFFKDFFEGPDFQRRFKRNSLGSGVIIDGNRGFILTNEHVVAKAGKITVVLNDEREFEAQIVGADADSDLAVLRLETDDALPSVQMGSSNDLLIGETVIAIGNPFGFSHTVTTGVVSALHRNIRTEDRIYRNFIQIDASINPGNSGGPLLNINGELIGINTAIYAKAQGIGFAIPINKAKRIVNDLIRYGEVIPAWIGLVVQNIDAKISAYFNLTDDSGVVVKSLDRDSPAEKAGIKIGDIILSIKGDKVISKSDYHQLMREFSAGQLLPMKIFRNGQIFIAEVQSAAFPVERAAELAYRLLGIRVSNIGFTDRARYHISAENGVVISELDPEAYLSGIGVRVGDVIRRIDDMAISSVENFNKAIVKFRQKSSFVMLIQRGGNGYYITVTP